MDIYLTLFIIAFCLLLEGFFSGSEIGVVSADQIKLRHMAAKGSKGARLALKMLETPEWLLSITLVGTNIAVVTNTTMVTALMIHFFGESGSWMAVAIAAPLIWIFGEIVPKSVFQQRADSLTPIVIFLLRFCSYLFYPILIVFSFATRLLTKLAGGEAQNPFTMREEIVTMMHMPALAGGDIKLVEQNMIRRMFNFSETAVHDVMTPLIDVVAVEKGVSCQEAKQISAANSHIRLPVYDKRVDRVVGMLHTLDLLEVPPDEPISGHIRPAHYVPASKSIKDLMLELRKEGKVVAVVIDEFGGAEGIATLEDIMEEVVEELEDEHDAGEAPEQWMKKLGERDFIVNARVELDELCAELGFDLPKGRYVTLAGLMLDIMHTVPAGGAEVEENGVTLTVQKSSPQAILEVRVRW